MTINLHIQAESVEELHAQIAKLLAGVPAPVARAVADKDATFAVEIGDEEPTKSAGPKKPAPAKKAPVKKAPAKKVEESADTSGETDPTADDARSLAMDLHKRFGKTCLADLSKIWKALGISKASEMTDDQGPAAWASLKELEAKLEAESK